MFRLPSWLSSKAALALLLVLTGGSACAQQADYGDIFGDAWQKAEAFEAENRCWMEPMLKKNHIPYNLAMAVVFPELVRYSALRDKMETTLLKALFVNLGEEYANFSIGRFQIKPSFAHIIREESDGVLSRRSGFTFKKPGDFDNEKNYRKSIVIDLEDPRTEFTYVIAFLKICEKRFRTGKMQEEERIRFVSAAYNCGIDKTFEEISAMADKRFFSARLIKSELYSYSDISLYWYQSNK